MLLLPTMSEKPLSFSVKLKWATSRQSQQYGMCTPEDSDQPEHLPSLTASLSAWRMLGSLATHWAHSKDWSDWADAQADLSLRWVHSHFVGFVMRQLKCSAASHHPGEIKNRLLVFHIHIHFIWCRNEAIQNNIARFPKIYLQKKLKK